MIAADVLIIGGGINGVGIARDAAGRGLKVALCEKNDLASATSSASSKLIHGGLRYLEHYEFRLVREALLERENLLAIAPHVVSPMRFVLPHDRSLRPAWMIRAGLFLYDHLARRRRLPGSHALDLRRDKAGAALQSHITRGFDYADCAVDDSRLVVLNAIDAAERGATILVRHECVAARIEDGRWRATLCADDGETIDVSARVMVNAAGPWVGHTLRDVVGRDGDNRLRLVKGSHIVVPAIENGEQAYILQNADGRIVFVIPYQQRFSLIGTTDIPYSGDPKNVAIDADEIDYLCATVNRYFHKATTPQDIVWSYSGVRPLYDDSAANPSAVTRDYVFDIDGGETQPALLSIFGGKITTYRKLAEHALEKLAPYLPAASARPWTQTAPLPGGNIADGDIERFIKDQCRRFSELPAELVARYARAYGSRMQMLLGERTRTAELGEHFGAGLYEAEARYLCDHEWARTADDILWRRSKLGLHIDTAGRARLEGWLTHAPAPAATRQEA